MNKERIGDFLSVLRREKNLTQQQLSNRLNGGIYSDGTISKWERGESVPNIEDLKALAQYFNVTVDEILNGTRYEEVDLEKKYFIYKNDWLSHYNPDDLYDIREEQELLIETRFKKLLKKMVGEGLSLPEDKEFDFIVNHFYQIFLPAIKRLDSYEYRNSGLAECAYMSDINEYLHAGLSGGLSDIKLEIYQQTALMHNAGIEEKFWEAYKKFIFSKRQNVRDDINNVIEDMRDALRDRLNTLEDFEKDILLATLQQTNVKNTLAIAGSKGQELYEERYGRKYDEEQLTKQAIKLLIECGAKLNKKLLGYWEMASESHRIVDELERIKNNYISPLLVPVCENGKYRYHLVINTENNRQKLKIKYENEIFGENDYSELEKRLYAGETTVLIPRRYFIGDIKQIDSFVYAHRQIMGMTFESYTKSRDGQATQELLTDLDNLPLVEIRKKYFLIEFKGEYINDQKSMSFEELNRKYYIKGVSNE